MNQVPIETPNIQAIALELSLYPIIQKQIRQRMRAELFRRGVVSPGRLEQEVKDKARQSQVREGITDPFKQEDAATWEERKRTVLEDQTDFYFANNLPLELFHQIIREAVAERAGRDTAVKPTFNLEQAPLDLVLRYASHYESLTGDARAEAQHHLEESIVVLIRTMISDHLDFVHIAKKWFTAHDFEDIRTRRIGEGKIGGKAAGMLLAWKILNMAAPEVAQHVTLPESYFIGADVIYDFLWVNGLDYINQKYKTPEQIEAEYPHIVAVHEKSRFPEPIAERLREFLSQMGKRPLIVRSSSLLEDNFGTSFAGKYESFFCPNQGTLKENLRDLTLAIRRIYASVYSPDALFYRRRMGLLDYDERMAVLLQEVQGEYHRQYFFPALAGVAFSRSPIVWNSRLRREEGFVRLVWGLGTRAVERVGEDYPRLVMLSHPTLRPETTPSAIEHYSQHLIDLIDLEANQLRTVPVRDVLGIDYPPLRWMVSVREDRDTLMPMYSLGQHVSPERLVLTFDNLLQQGKFVGVMKGVLSTLEREYQFPVDVEFAATLSSDDTRSGVKLHLLQCRPQSSLKNEAARPVPPDLQIQDKLFFTSYMVPQGQVNDIEYVVYVDHACYGRLMDSSDCLQVARLVGQLNKALEGRTFILIGPGRWGSSNMALGVPVTYADIYNTRALIELTVAQQGIVPEPSYGTHFFQDLVEAQIYPLVVYPGEYGDFINQEFLDQAANGLRDVLPNVEDNLGCIKVIHIPAERPGCHLSLTMDGERALAYVARSDAAAGAAPAPALPPGQNLIFGPEW